MSSPAPAPPCHRRLRPSSLERRVGGGAESRDLAGLRYLFPWAGRGSSRLPIHLPPGGTSRLDELASAISERAGFFDDAYAVDEYDPGATFTVGQLKLRFAPGRHYVPAWGVSVETPDGARLVYTGDTGPSQ